MDEPTIMTSRWGVQIEGNEYDLDNLEEKLNGSLRDDKSFFVSKINDVVVLRSSRWDQQVDVKIVEEIARRDLLTINACISILDGCQTFNIGTIYFFKQNGGITLSRTSTVNVYFAKQKEKRESPERFLEVLRHSIENVDVDNVLIHLIGSPDWVDIYKSIEAMEKIAGGERNLVEYARPLGINIKNIKINANYHRHINRYDPPVKTIFKVEALIQLRKVAGMFIVMDKSAVEDLSPAVEKRFTLSQYEYDNPEDAHLNPIVDSPTTSFDTNGIAQVEVDVSSIKQLKGN